MRYLSLSLLVLLVACTDAIAGPQAVDIRGDWNFWSLAFGPLTVGSPPIGNCQIVGRLSITSQSGNTFSGSFSGIRGCDGPYPSYNVPVNGSWSADSLFFDFDANARVRGNRLNDRLGGTVVIVSGAVRSGRWSAERCGPGYPKTCP
jgi:hypothetical protein